MAFDKKETNIYGCYCIDPHVFGDERGFFMETYSASAFTQIGIDTLFVQDNHSKSKKGVLRGLHFQTRNPQAKLVRVTAGAVYDVVLDLRKDSPTFGRWQGFELTDSNKRMLYIPRGCAHGFLTLVDDTEFLYKCDAEYDPGFEGGICWDDPDLQIDWKALWGADEAFAPELSEKDKKHPLFRDYSIHPIF